MRYVAAASAHAAQAGATFPSGIPATDDGSESVPLTPMRAGAWAQWAQRAAAEAQALQQGIDLTSPTPVAEPAAAAAMVPAPRQPADGGRLPVAGVGGGMAAPA